jgi:hypothetical protein
MVETEVEQIHMPSIGEDAPPFTAKTEERIYCLDWFMCLKRESEK